MCHLKWARRDSTRVVSPSGKSFLLTIHKNQTNRDTAREDFTSAMATYSSFHYITLTAVILLVLSDRTIAMPVNVTIAATQPQNGTILFGDISSDVLKLGAWEPTVDTFISLGGFVLDAVLKGIQIYFAKEQLKAFLCGKSTYLLIFD